MFFVFFNVIETVYVYRSRYIYIYKNTSFFNFFFEKLGLYKIEWHCLGSCDHGSTHKVTQPGTWFWKMQLQKKKKQTKKQVVMTRLHRGDCGDYHCFNYNYTTHAVTL